MAELGKQILKNILLGSAALLLSYCANQLPPGGGDIDRIPPGVTEVYPENGSTSFEDDYFELGFSEYVDKRSVKDAIFISPAIQGNLDLDWSGKYVRVYFPEKLKPNTTYVITVGTDVVDFNNHNNMAKAFTFTFSTGKEIDRRTITGRVYQEKPQGILMLAYKLTSVDTINPMKNKPDYISQTGKDGTFALNGMAAGTYRIFAVQDEFRDLTFQPDQDKIGMPFTDIVLRESDSLYTGLNFFITKIDTMSPRLLNASMIDKFHVLVNFSEEIDSTIYKKNNFFIYDSTSNKKIGIRYFYKGSAKPTEIFFVPDDTIPPEDNVFLHADTIKDKASNIFLNDNVYLNLSSRPDTIPPGIIKSIPPAGSKDADFLKEKFSFFFNDAFDTSNAKSGISFRDTLGKAVPIGISFTDDASFTLEPLKNLEPKKYYIISIDLSKISDAAGNKRDSVYKSKIQTISGLDFTGASGKLSGIELNANPVLVLEGTSPAKILGNGKNIYTRKPDKNYMFNFERVEAGKYTLWCYLDKDSSGSYSFGYHFPFKPSEEFSVYPDTLNLKARWMQTDLNFIFK
ncbi:MAG TPA: Ig-like domain-containing protein [Ignavibacteriaceae bacterium]|nr:Ig-like domain-containing protein [Ignavibacteriaceae bacterium]